MMVRPPLSAALATLLTGLVMVLAPPSHLPAKTAEATQTIITIGDDAITLPAPANACFLEPDAPHDGELFSAVQRSIGTTNQLVAIFADCAELAVWRKHEGLLAHHGQVQTMVKLTDRRLTMSRQNFAQEVCAHETATSETATSPSILIDDQSWLDKKIRQLGINQQHFLGAVAVDAEACFTGLIQKIQTGTEAVRPEFAITATTLVRGKVIYVYLYTPASGRDGFKALLANAKRLVNALLKANGG